MAAAADTDVEDASAAAVGTDDADEKDILLTTWAEEWWSSDRRCTRGTGLTMAAIAENCAKQQFARGEK